MTSISLAFVLFAWGSPPGADGTAAGAKEPAATAEGAGDDNSGPAPADATNAAQPTTAPDVVAGEPAAPSAEASNKASAAHKSAQHLLAEQKVEEALGPRITVDELVRAALANHPNIRAVDERIAALGHAIPQAWVLPDPVFATEYSNMPILAPWPGNHPMSGIQLKLSQKLPFPTKLFARADAAEAIQAAAVPSREEEKNQISTKVRMLAVRWQVTRGLADVTARHIEAVDELLDTVRVKYEVGRVEQYELIRLDVLRDKLSDDLVELDRQRDALTAALNAIAQRPYDAKLNLGPAVEIPAIPEEELQALLDEAIQKRPLLKSFVAGATAERAQAKARRADKWPDLTTWIGYRVRLANGADPGNNFITAGISIPLPWQSIFWKWEEKAQAHEAKAKVQEAQRDGVLLSLRGEIEANQVRYRRATERVKVYLEELIPGADKTLEAAFASYTVDRAGFAELFSAEITALEFERVVVRTRADAAAAAISIDMLTGRYQAAMNEKGSAP